MARGGEAVAQRRGTRVLVLLFAALLLAILGTRGTYALWQSTVNIEAPGFRLSGPEPSPTQTP